MLQISCDLHEVVIHYSVLLQILNMTGSPQIVAKLNSTQRIIMPRKLLNIYNDITTWISAALTYDSIVVKELF